LALGLAGDSRTATLRIANLSLLDLRAGGVATINAGSVLRIAAGGTLVVRNGTTLNVAGQLLVDPGAYLCLENGQSIATTGSGQVTIGNSVYRYPNPILGLTGLSCQGANCTSTVALGYECPVLPENVCSANVTVTATGNSLGTNYRWTLDGQPVSTADGQASLIVFVQKSLNSRRVTVQVSGTCLGSSTLTASTTVGCGYTGARCTPRGAGASVAMFPNPATSSVEFKAVPDTTPLASQGATTTQAALAAPAPTPAEFNVSLYDGQGALRWQGRSRGGVVQFNSAGLPRGLYGVVITQGTVVERRNLSLE